MVPSGGVTEKSPATPPGIVPGTVRLAAQCPNHYANPGCPIRGRVENLKERRFIVFRNGQRDTESIETYIMHSGET